MNDNNKTSSSRKSPSLKERIQGYLPGHQHQQPLKITDANLEERRAEMIQRGKRLKYPLQVSKSHLILISIILVVLVLAASTAWLYAALYHQQKTTDFYYSVVKILPVSVAKVDGEPVRYADYLRLLRGDIHYTATKDGQDLTDKDGQRQLEYYKRNDLNRAEFAAYVSKLARENNVSISDSEVDDYINRQRKLTNATEEEWAKVSAEYYGWTTDDYRAIIKDQLLGVKLAYKVDTSAKDKATEISNELKAGGDFATVAKERGDSSDNIQSGDTLEAKLSDNDPTGIVNRVKELDVNQTTDIEQATIGSSNYYYIAKLLAKDDTSVQYSLILVQLSKLDNDFAQLQKSDKIQEYIKVEQNAQGSSS